MPGGEHCRRSTSSAVPCGIHFQRQWQKRGVAAAVCISARSNVGRARHASQSRKRAAASKTPIVFACRCPWNARLFETFARDALLDGLHLFIRRICRLRPCRKISPEALDEQLQMGCMRARVLVALCARFSRGCSCAKRWPVPFMVSNRMCRTPRMRALCVEVGMQSLLYISKDP